jgi:hypothetical protein
MARRIRKVVNNGCRLVVVVVVVLVVCLTTVVGTKARLLKSAAAGVISGMLCLGDPTTVLGTDMPLLDDLNVVQAQLRKVRREEDNTSAIFKQLEYLLNNFQLPSKIQYTINSVAPEGRACAITTSGKLSNDLRVITGEPWFRTPPLIPSLYPPSLTV